jgi:GTP-binding protein
MKFVDEIEIDVRGGHGGAGCVSFLREKCRPKGGPNGGNGGDGGEVMLVVDSGLSTLLDFRYQRRLEARNGEPGRGKNQFGRRGRDVQARVPPGTVVREVESGEILADLKAPGESAVVAHGGRGGRGNATYVSPTNQAPRRSQPGTPGEEHRLRLELRLMADIGLLGFPNVGKSTLIRRVSAARPRVADYPFTTLVPHLGVVRLDDFRSFVLADIPGLVEGAHRGQGLGLRFLRHLSRTELLIHMVDISALSERDPIEDLDVINRELAHFDERLASKIQIVAGNKIDLVTSKRWLQQISQRFRSRGIPLHLISAATGQGVQELMNAAAARLDELRHRDALPAGRNKPHGGRVG